MLLGCDWKGANSHASQGPRQPTLRHWSLVFSSALRMGGGDTRAWDRSMPSATHSPDWRTELAHAQALAAPSGTRA